MSENVLLFVILFAIGIVCQDSRHHLPSHRRSMDLEKVPYDVYETICSKCLNFGFGVEKLLTLESEVISFCWLALEENKKLHSRNSDGHNHNYSFSESFLKETRRANDVALNNVDAIASHPLSVFRLRRRVASTWPQVFDEINGCEFVGIYLQSSFGRRFRQLSDALLEDSDPQKTIINILFLQRFYHLTASSLSSGCVYWSCVEPLTSNEVKVIAQTAIDDYEDHHTGLEWIETRLEPSCGGNHCLSSTFEEKRSLKTLKASCLLMTARYSEAKTAYEELLQPNSSNVAINSIIKTIEQRLNVNEFDALDKTWDNENDDVSFTSNDDNDFASFSAFCRGMTSSKTSVFDEKSLLCHNLRSPSVVNSSIYFERLHENPSVIMIHDFFTSSQTHAIVKTANKKVMEELNTLSFTGNRMNTPGERIKLTKSDQWMDVIESRFRNMTYSKMTEWMNNSMDQFQMTVTNAGVGWRKSRMSSEFEELAEVFGKQLGIFHVFLNEPILGGSLVFPKLKLQIEPKQGAAVFWEFKSRESTTLVPNFEEVLQCPVLLGTQWVAKLLLLQPAEEILNFQDDTFRPSI